MSSTGGLSTPVVAKPGAARPTATAAPAPAPAAAPPAVTRDEVDILVRRAGLSLNAGQKADLAVSYQQIVALTSRIPRDRPIWDEPCFTVRPAAPPAAAEPAAATRPRPAAKAAKPAGRKAPAKPAKTTKPSARARPGKPGGTGRPARKSARARR
ncbi:hypothetical protein [Elioraea sp.]|uniref:hypothetical protein n=1 Tax=Elioraea sp. TaxID=2185103 RepID=UPI00307F3AA6